MMIKRDSLKKKAKELAMRDLSYNLASEEQREAWSEFKQIRNKINDTKKNEEHKFKKNKSLKV